MKTILSSIIVSLVLGTSARAGDIYLPRTPASEPRDTRKKELSKREAPEEKKEEVAEKDDEAEDSPAGDELRKEK